jgi:hypothetical protein
MFLLALTARTESTTIATAALAVFLLGTAALLTGVVIAMVEVHSSHRVIEFEVSRVTMAHARPPRATDSLSSGLFQ